MVTFICEYCDTTLKKKQCDNHVRSSCRPGSLICIDCGSNFRNLEFKTHNSCISEQQKHWGEYAKPKKTKPIAKQQKKNIHKAKELETKITTETKIIAEEEEEKCDDQNDWKGWKNQLKTIIKQNKNKIEKQQLMQKVKEKYLQKGGDDEITDEFLNQKISKLKNTKQIVYVVYEQ